MKTRQKSELIVKLEVLQNYLNSFRMSCSRMESQLTQSSITSQEDISKAIKVLDDCLQEIMNRNIELSCLIWD